MQPTPNWRGLFFDLFFIQRQPIGQMGIKLCGVGYECLRLPAIAGFTRIKFTRGR